MKKRITEYLAYIDALLEKEDVDWEHEKEKHPVCIGNCDFNLVFEF